jgi:hypothetical protein
VLAGTSKKQKPKKQTTKTIRRQPRHETLISNSMSLLKRILMAVERLIIRGQYPDCGGFIETELDSPNLSPVKPSPFNAQTPTPLSRPKLSSDASLSAQLGGLSLDLRIGDEETYFAKILLMRYLSTDPNHNLDIHVATLPALPPNKSRIDSMRAEAWMARDIISCLVQPRLDT